MKTQSKEKYHQALKNIQWGDFNNAESILEDLLALHPDHPDVLHLLGVCHLESQQIKSAVDCLEKIDNPATGKCTVSISLRAFFNKIRSVGCSHKCVQGRPGD